MLKYEHQSIAVVRAAIEQGAVSSKEFKRLHNRHLPTWKYYAIKVLNVAIFAGALCFIIKILGNG